MAGSNQSKKETVDIELPVPPLERPPDPKVKSRNKARMELPVREPEEKAPLPIVTPTVPSVPAAHGPGSPGLTTETAIVSDLPDLPAAEVEEPGPLSGVSGVTVDNAPIAAAPTEKNPLLLMCILLGLSALILIIQIWTYFS